MSEYRERRTVVEDVPIKRARPVAETQYDSVVHERRGMSGGAVAALVLAAIAAAVVITMLILNNQQKNSDEELAQERARNEIAQQAPAQQPQQPPVIVMPQTQQTPPAATPAPVPVPSQTPPTTTSPTSTELEIDINSKLLDDQDLRSYSIDVKVTDGTAMLTGRVPTNDLKTRAEKLARTVKGVRSVINNIVVKPD